MLTAHEPTDFNYIHEDLFNGYINYAKKQIKQ